MLVTIAIWVYVNVLAPKINGALEGGRLLYARMSVMRAKVPRAEYPIVTWVQSKRALIV